jgi:hypothetical protein
MLIVGLSGPFEISFTSWLAAGDYIWSYFAGVEGPGGAVGCFQAVVVPEPSTLVVFSLIAGVGLAGAWYRKRRKPVA